MRKLRPREAEGLAEGHIHGQWQNSIVNWVCLTPEPVGTVGNVGSWYLSAGRWESRPKRIERV